MTGVTWHPSGDLIATADTSGLIRISHLDGTLERAFISVRPRVPGVESYASWTSEGLDVLEGEAWRVLRVPEPGGGSRRLELPGLSYEPRAPIPQWFRLGPLLRHIRADSITFPKNCGKK